jgi:hypothetical protein
VNVFIAPDMSYLEIMGHKVNILSVSVNPCGQTVPAEVDEQQILSLKLVNQVK